MAGEVTAVGVDPVGGWLAAGESDLPFQVYLVEGDTARGRRKRSPLSSKEGRVGGSDGRKHRGKGGVELELELVVLDVSFHLLSSVLKLTSLRFPLDYRNLVRIYPPSRFSSGLAHALDLQESSETPQPRQRPHQVHLLSSWFFEARSDR